jgi:hypothetical protein
MEVPMSEPVSAEEPRPIAVGSLQEREPAVRERRTFHLLRPGGWLVSAASDDESVFVRYRADIWVEVATDGDVVAVVVDSAGLAQPVEAIRGDLSPVRAEDRASAVDAAQTGMWPSWDVGPSPAAAAAEREAG